jgi:hypothetical protein
MIAAAFALLWAIAAAWLIGRAMRQYRAYEVISPAAARGEAPQVDVVVAGVDPSCDQVA